MSLAVVGVTSAVGAAGHWRAGNVNVRTGATLCGGDGGHTSAGTRLAAFLSGTTQLAIFGAVMLVAAAFMFRGRRDDTPSRRHGSDTATSLVMLEGLAVGLLTGLVGVGGEF